MVVVIRNGGAPRNASTIYREEYNSDPADIS